METSTCYIGCGVCDLIHTVSQLLHPLESANGQLLRALAFLQFDVDPERFRTGTKNGLPRAMVDNHIRQYINMRISLADMYRIIAQYRPATLIQRCETNLQYTAELLVEQWKKDGKKEQTPKVHSYVHTNNKKRKEPI